MHVAVDIDGVLADSIHRASYASDPDKFYGAIPDDKPISEMVSLVRSLMQRGHKVTFFTARHDRARASTLDWLNKHVTLIGRQGTPELYMRADGDLAPSHEYKLAVCKWLKPDLIIDDDDKTCHLLYDNGFKVLLFLRDKEFTANCEAVEKQLGIRPSGEKPPPERFPSHIHRKHSSGGDIVKDAMSERASIDSRTIHPRE